MANCNGKQNEIIESDSSMYIKEKPKFVFFSFVDVNVMLDKFSTDNCYGKKLFKVHIF